jgi:hypothetical protein
MVVKCNEKINLFHKCHPLIHFCEWLNGTLKGWFKKEIWQNLRHEIMLPFSI